METFVLTPAQEKSDKIRDLTTANGVNIFQSATEALSIEFDGTSFNIYIFCDKLTERK